jgi:Domain of unknown function (DUF4132)
VGKVRKKTWREFVGPGEREECTAELNRLVIHVDEIKAAPEKDFKKTKFARHMDGWYDVGPAFRHARATLVAIAACEQGKDQQAGTILLDLLSNLLRRNLPFTVEHVDALLNAGSLSLARGRFGGVLPGVLGAIERIFGSQSLADNHRDALAAVGARLAKTEAKPSKAAAKLRERIDALCNDSTAGRLLPDGGWADDLRTWIDKCDRRERAKWEALLRDAAAVKPDPPATKWKVDLSDTGLDYMKDLDAAIVKCTEMQLERAPTAEWARTMATHLEGLGRDRVGGELARWLHRVPNSKPGMLVRTSLNRELMRGLLWTCREIAIPEIAQAVQHATKYFYKNNSPLAEAGVAVLYRTGTGAAAAALAAIAATLHRESQQKFVELALSRVTESAGVGPDEFAAESIPTFGFTQAGRWKEQLGNVKVCMEIRPTRAVDMVWSRADGTELKSIPAAIKREFGERIESLKTTAKGIKEALAGVSVRLEGSWLTQGKFQWENLRGQLIDHVIGGVVGSALIWDVESDSKRKAALWRRDRLVDVRGRRVSTAGDATVRLWHPLDAPVDEVLAWRELLMSNEILQPFKQAYREVYVLTDAERRTRTYSNRFAAHILRQAQFRQLAKTRGWKVGLMGPWDGGDHQHAEKKLPRWNLRAQFWVNLAGNDMQTGYTYVATDQVRFYRLNATDNDEPLTLDQVPPLVLSEVMRDVDLFVGVASVGNDPNWADGGPGGRYRDYWQSYSFGELSATAQTRRALLEKLIPRLTIAGRCKLADRFLVVRGDIRTYKIHLGSGNILMAPNDQYLCIVAKQTVAGGDRVFLPFEGDGTLSVILSKAFLLAADTQITDPTITSQLKR